MVTSLIGGTPLKKREVERLLEEILRQQKAENPNQWTYFSEEQLAKSMHRPRLSWEERSLLNILCDGGRLPSHPQVIVEAGYLERFGKRYLIAEPLRAVFKQFVEPVRA